MSWRPTPAIPSGFPWTCTDNLEVLSSPSPGFSLTQRLLRNGPMPVPCFVALFFFGAGEFSLSFFGELVFCWSCTCARSILALRVLIPSEVFLRGSMRHFLVGGVQLSLGLAVAMVTSNDRVWLFPGWLSRFCCCCCCSSCIECPLTGSSIL